MSKPMKEMIVEEYKSRFGDLEGALVVDIRGIDANTNNEMRQGLYDQSVRITVVKNTLAKQALAGTSLEALDEALDGPAALAYGGESVVDVARTIVDWAKKVKQLDLKGAVLDGEYFDGAAGIKRLSEFPTKDEARAQVVSLLLAPFQQVISAATAPGADLMGILTEMEERLEEGQTIAKV